MLRDPKVIEYFNRQLTNELTAVNQYFLHARTLEQRLDPIRVGEDVEQILGSDRALEEKAINDLRDGIAFCESVRDFVSRDLLRMILESEEEHIDFLERQFDLIKQIGVERYVQLNAAAASRDG